MSNSELACVYASLLLADDGVAVTGDKITTLLKAAHVNFVEPYLPDLFASALEGKNVKDLLFNMTSSVASAPASSSAPAAAAADSKAPAAAEKKPAKVEEPESDDEDMGFDLFG